MKYYPKGTMLLFLGRYEFMVIFDNRYGCSVKDIKNNQIYINLSVGRLHDNDFKLIKLPRGKLV